MSLKITKRFSLLFISGIALSALIVVFGLPFYEVLHDKYPFYTAVTEAVILAFVAMIFIGTSLQFKEIKQNRVSDTTLLEQRLHAMEAAKDGIGIVDANGNLTYMNKALKELHGISDEVGNVYIGQRWDNLYIGQGQEQIRTIVMPHLEEKGYWRGESSVIRADGNTVDAELSLAVLPDGGFIGTTRDISQKKIADKEKIELQKQFFQAQKMEAIGRLAGGIAHDFNNILAAMNGYAEFLIDDLDEKTSQHKFASNILQAGLQARKLVDQMLAFSRRSDGEESSFDLIAPLNETFTMLNASLPKTIELEKNITLSSAPLNGSATQISQVLMNLCVNAKDAMESDHGTLKVMLESRRGDDVLTDVPRLDDLPSTDSSPPIRIDDLSPTHSRLILGSVSTQHDYYSIVVADSGSGMSRVIMEHIFEPFFTTKPVDQGTGLGLATVHGVVAAHKGVMIIDSVIGEGTTFELLFPASGALNTVKEGEQSGEIQNISGQILLVEDQEEVRDMMFNMLTRMGHDVQTCDSGLEGLSILREDPDKFDVVVTDHNMPKMSGLEMIQQIALQYADIPFIVVSGYSEEKLKAMIVDHPSIKSVLRKPASKHDLSQKINEVLSANTTDRKNTQAA